MKKFFIILSVLVAAIFAFLVFEGLFSTAKAFEGEEGGYKLIGIDHKELIKTLETFLRNCANPLKPLVSKI